MSNPHQPLVIGIYGGSRSSHVADFAQALGAAFARAGHIVLTGAEPRTERTWSGNVRSKERAVRAAHVWAFNPTPRNRA
jgi:hypothetical protein